MPAVDLSIPQDWKPHSREWTRVYGAAANGDIDEARRRVLRGEGTIDDVRYGWADYLYQQNQIKIWTPILIAAGVAFIGSAQSGTAKPAQPPKEESYYNPNDTYEARQNRDAVHRGDDHLPYPGYPTAH